MIIIIVPLQVMDGFIHGCVCAYAECREGQKNMCVCEALLLLHGVHAYKKRTDSVESYAAGATPASAVFECWNRREEKSPSVS